MPKLVPVRPNQSVPAMDQLPLPVTLIVHLQISAVPGDEGKVTKILGSPSKMMLTDTNTLSNLQWLPKIA